MEYGSYIIEEKVVALRPCVKAETVGKVVKDTKGWLGASNCRLKGRTKFLLIAATLARRVCFPHLELSIHK